MFLCGRRSRRQGEMMWMYAALILLLPEAWSQEPGTNQSTSVNSTTSSPPPMYVARHLTFNLGNDADLMCSNKTWNETMFVIWNIYLKYKHCKIAFNSDGRSDENCKDGKSLRNTSSAQPYLHIPNFSNDDVGIYKCESVYNGGSENYEINVAITVPPSLSTWLEPKDKKMVAVCKAEGGKPAANISWSHTGKIVETLFESNGFFTVESRLELLEGMDTRNLNCTIKHPYWRKEQILGPKPLKGYVSWLCALAVVVIVVIVAGISFFAQKKPMLGRSQQSNASPSKSAPREDVEEVEPYASYVQRVNSIYNSSADLFK